ncbi:MAG: hypothetical protein CMQ24_09535 [Gammaproteobacteria bacterium]|nr:hypothetical protein [Gammaproteobacteria bacterium]
MLHDPERHTAIDAGPWSSNVAEASIDAFVADTLRDLAGHDLWPIHPLDRSPERSATLKTLYYGAAGMFWTLSELGAGVPAATDILARARRAAAREADDLYPHARHSFLMGDAGFAMLQLKLGHAEPSDLQLLETLTPGLGVPPTGIVWGCAGTLLALRFAFERTNDPRMHDDARDGLRSLLDARETNGLWVTDLNEHRDSMLSALHGYAANMAAAIRVAPSDDLAGAVQSVLAEHALRDADGVNWPLSAGSTTRAVGRPPLLQYCNGAPGVIVCLGGFFDEAFEREYLLPTGELIWRAGPLTKLPSLCHGVAGSGFAFLRLFEMTEDTLWLDRARAFAMHGIRANARFISEHGQRKYSLWTGDAGFVLFLRACIEGNAAFPTLDFF